MIEIVCCIEGVLFCDYFCKVRIVYVFGDDGGGLVVYDDDWCVVGVCCLVCVLLGFIDGVIVSGIDLLCFDVVEYCKIEGDIVELCCIGGGSLF